MPSPINTFKGDEIVISGISGTFPNTENVQQLGEKLFNKVDMVNRINKDSGIKHPEFPQYSGTVERLEKFDAHFFRITARQAKWLDPSLGNLLEHTFSAFFDAGINPVTLKGSRIGVFVASMQLDSIQALFHKSTANPFRLTGVSKTMFANRISYWIDGKGPSYTFDNGCAGSMSALEMAYNSLKSGEISCAVVGAVNYCFMPELTLSMKRAGLLCSDGKTKCFDKSGDGFVRSDAFNVYILQRAKDAKRIYTEVYHVKSKYFASPDGSFCPKRNPKDIEKFMEEFYSEIDVTPEDVQYVEANSFGIAEADGNELDAIGNVFAKNKSIKIGSVKSNMGNTEAASGACSITKMCLAYQKGQIPANLHFNEFRNDIKAAKEGKLQVVTENLPFNRNFTAINNFCYTGANVHTLLKGHYKPKDTEKYKSTIPRLVLVSGRKEENVNKILDILETNPIDPEQLALINNFYKHYVPGYTGRGYTILDTNEKNETTCLSRGFEVFSGSTRPIWFLFSGMGSQWAGMGEGLLIVPVFASAIEKCHKILLPKGLNIIKIITDKDIKNLNILNSLVAITAIQIGLCDVLTSLGIVPDNIIGHSLGEIACGYADGSFTAEETILTAYFRGLVAYETDLIKGAMAAVGLGHNEVSKICPPKIAIACHNSSQSTTISGPADVITEFVNNLTSQGIFAKEVNSYNIAFHSQYIAETGPKLLKLLKEVIKNPKFRSKKWVSTCYLPKNWHNPESKYASAEYMVHNLLGSVLFEEAAAFIPNDALIIEIAPHGLLQAIMKRSHSQCVNVSLTRRGESDGAKILLKSLGRLYQIGLNPDLEALYPKVEFPVSTETSTMSHFIGWDYSVEQTCFVIKYETDSSNTKEFSLWTYDDEYAYLRNYVRNGIHILPEAAMLVFVWKTLAYLNDVNYKDMPVTFENIKIYEEIVIQPIVRLEVAIQKGSQTFQINYKNNVVLEGIIKKFNKKDAQHYDTIKFNETEKHLTQNDIYTILRTRGYSYEDEFQLILSSNIKRNAASVKWNDQWITFLDSIIQLKTLSIDHDGISSVKYIRKLTIDTNEHEYKLEPTSGVQYHNALISKNTGVTRCGGVVFHDLIFNETNNEIEPDVLKINILDYDNSKLCSYVPIKDKDDFQRFELIAKKRDNIESLTWTNAAAITNKTMIQVCYSGLSIKDYKNLSSSSNQSFGMDFSGLDKNGNKVMGIIPQGAVATTVEADYDLLWPVPQKWSLAEAATVPLPFIHAYYCLAIRSSVAYKDNIFIIGAAGALGQAVISIALSLHCTIFGTVANADKKRFLLKLFPELDENNIGYTYDDSFLPMVIKRTNKKKCKIVISSAAGKVREAAMGCVAYYSHFLDVNLSDQAEYKKIPMYFLDPDTSYKSVNVSTIFTEKYRHYKKVLHNMVSEGISKGIVKPVTSVIFSPLDVSKAFKLLSTRKNKGRVLINMTKFEMEKQDLVKICRISLDPVKSYLILWDGSELGVELIDRLVKRGAKRLLVHCTPKSINGYFHVKYATWTKLGLTIELNSDNLKGEDECQRLITKTETKLGLLDGIFITCNYFGKKSDIIDEEKDNNARIVPTLDMASRQLHLRYFAVLTTVSQVINEDAFKAIEECCLIRNECGLPSLLLSHAIEDETQHPKCITALLNALESCLTNKYVRVRTSFITDNEIENEEENIKKDKLNTNFEAGLIAFYRHVPKDEIDDTEPIIRMKSRLFPNLQRELTIDPDDPYMILIPGFEGNAKSLTALSEVLKTRALVLQLDPKNNSSIPEISKILLEYVKARTHLRSPFHIMGYSFGLNIALEMAVLLEKEGLVGVVYCLDSSPDAMRVHLDAYLGALTDEQLQNCLIEHVYTLLVGDKSDDLKAKLKETTEWSKKVEFFINKAKYDVHHSHEYMRSLLQAAYARIKMAKDYKPNFKLDSELVLFRGISHPNAKQLSEDYNLSKYTNKQVTVIDIESDHAMALFDSKVSNYINRFFVV